MFESPPVHTHSYQFVGTFSCAQIDLRKAQERELATLDEKSTSSGIAEPYDMGDKSWRQEPGGGEGRDDTCDHGLSRIWKADDIVCK